VAPESPASAGDVLPNPEESGPDWTGGRAQVEDHVISAEAGTSGPATGT
jgi:hypothetical protein